MHPFVNLSVFQSVRRSVGVIVLVTFSPPTLDDTRAKTYCACSRCGAGCLDIFSLVCRSLNSSVG